jgi:hypothetical protein
LLSAKHIGTGWFGKDDGTDVECRVTETALTKRCGANGITNAELHRAFKDNQSRIETVAKRKYAAGQVTVESDRTVIVIDVADL